MRLTFLHLALFLGIAVIAFVTYLWLAPKFRKPAIPISVETQPSWAPGPGVGSLNTLPTLPPTAFPR